MRLDMQRDSSYGDKMENYDYNLMRATIAPGDIMGYSKDGFPIHAAYAPGTVLGYSKDGYPIHAAGVLDDAVCGGSSLLFIAIGLGLGWLAADKFSSYMATRK